MTYLPGSFFLTAIPGLAGFGIGLGQRLAGAPSRYSHAGIVLDTDGTVLEAEPGGARIANLSEYAGRPLLISDAPVQQAVAASAASYARARAQAPKGALVAPPIPEEAFRQRVLYRAQQLIGVPYSALDYVALAALHLHLPSGWVRRRVETSGHMICSQLVDACFLHAGIHLYDDGRLPGDVMPADLASWAEDHEAKT